MLYTSVGYAQHFRLEEYYQKQIAKQIGGTREVVLDDNTRVDICTKSEVIEVEFARKWYESIGQVCHYSVKTGLKPVIYLIVETDKDNIYVERCRRVCSKLKLMDLQIEVKTYHSRYAGAPQNKSG